LKNAGLILDDYISKTLNKNSKVVTDWVDALLMQNIDYKASVDSTQVLPAAYTASTSQTQYVSQSTDEISDIASEQIPQNETISIIDIPAQKNSKLQNLYEKCAKQTDTGNYSKALENYDKLLQMAKKSGDKEIETQIHMDKAFIYDVENNLPAALDNYYNAAMLAGETGNYATKAKAHYNMATIYDDLGKVDSAMIHYYCSLSYDGEVENINGQALSLNNIGNLYTAQYNHKTGLDYYKVAYSLSKETDDKSAQATILSNVAGIFNELGYDDKSLKYYKDAIKLDIQAGNIEGYAKSYDLAGDIMLKNGQKEKAKNLYIRSMLAARETNDTVWQARMSEKIEMAG
jgi:tetratricopeptide (TPR) repeat protein